MSLGDLSEDEVEGIRIGGMDAERLGEGDHLAYGGVLYRPGLLKTGKKPALLGEQEISALGDRRACEILNKSPSLSDREKDVVLDMIQHLGELHDRQ